MVFVTTRIVPLLAICAAAVAAQDITELPLNGIRVISVAGFNVQGDSYDGGSDGQLSWEFSGGVLRYTYSRGGRTLGASFTMQPPSAVFGRTTGTSVAFTPAASFTATLTYPATNIGVEAPIGIISFPTEGAATIPCRATRPGPLTCSIQQLKVETAAEAAANGGAPRPYIDSLIATGIGLIDLQFVARTYFGPAPTSPALEPVIEVVQVTQTDLDDVPLIAGKKTVVRVFALQTGPAQAAIGPIRAKLHGWEMNGTRRTRDLGEVPEVPQSIAASLGVVDRDNPVSALTFALPDQWMCAPRNPASQSCRLPVESIEIRAELQLPPGRTVSDMGKLGGSKFLKFVASTPLRIIYFPLAYWKDGQRRAPSNNIGKHGDFLKKLFPIDAADIAYLGVPMSAFGTTDENGLEFRNIENPDIKSDLIAGIYEFLQVEGIPRYDQAVAWLNENAVLDIPAVGATYGYSDGVALGGQGKAVWVVDNNDPDDPLFTPETLAHEMGHNAGDLLHTNSDDVALDPKCKIAPDDETDWSRVFQYLNGAIQHPGYDPFEGRFIPRTYFDLMNYCPAEKTWISPEQYKKLLSRGTALRSGLAPQSVGKVRSAGETAELLGVGGSIQTDGSEGRLNPTQRFSTSEPASQPDPSGPYCLRFSRAGSTLSDFCFTPRLIDPGTGEPLTRTHFSLRVPRVPDATRLALIRRDAGGGERELTALNGGSGAPALLIVSPQPNEQTSGALTIEWNATDPGGLPLSYRVHFSNDAGATWYPLTFRALTSSRYVLDTSRIAGGDQVYFRVLALNGLDTTSAKVGPIRVVQSPQLALESATIDFGGVGLGQVATANLTLRNSGTGPHTVHSISIDKPEFQTSISLPLFIWSGGEPHTIPILFQSATPGPFEATLTINGETTVRLRAIVSATAVPVISAPAGIEFGTVNVGQAAERTLTISNTGASPLTVSSLTIDNARYTVSPASVASIAAGQSAGLSVRFVPTVAGVANGTLSIRSNDPNRALVTVALSGTGAVASGGGAASLEQIRPLTAEGWPNNRTFDNPARNAVDGSTSTFTWTTNPNNTQTPSYFGVDLGAAKAVSRIRLYKDNDGGGGTLSDFFKNLTIEYTTGSPSTPLPSRTWTRVTGLSNGYQGSESLTAVAVNADGTVTRDSHNSSNNGWASLTFTTVNATGIRIGFSNVTSATFFNHYKVHEFEAYGPAGSGGGTGSGGTGGSTAAGPNLLQNGSGDTTTSPVTGCTVPASIAGWTTDGRVGICSYNAGGGYPGPNDPGPPDRGANFYWGGNTAASSLNQVVSLASNAAQIDAGTQPFTFSAYLGGYAGDGDNVKATLTFLNQGGASVDAIVLGPVTPTDRAGRTGMFARSYTGNVPAGARSARVTLDFARTGGESNDGYADDIVFTLSTGSGTGVTGGTGEPVSVTVSPPSVALSGGGQQQFTATVARAQNTAVTWSIAPSVGTILPTGLYQAPATVSQQQTVIVTARSVQDSTKTATATVTLLPPSGGGGSGPALEIRRDNAIVTSLDFGTVSSGQSADLTLQVFNRGGVAASVNVTLDNPRFTLLRAATQPFPIGGGSFEFAIIRFTPVDASQQSGTATFTAGGQSLRLSLRGNGGGSTGGGGTAPSVTLQIDDGSYEDAVGFPQGGTTAYFVNRLTPAGYPATLRAVQILFPAGELPAGSQVSIVSGTHASGVGGQSLSGLTFQRTTGTVSSPGNFVEFAVPPASIQSGDFIVGFSLVNPPNIYPGAEDTSSGSRQRSYLSVDGVNFRLLDSISGATPGNFLIRAKVDSSTGGGTGGGATTLVTPLSAAGWPNGRTSNNLPASAIDGNTSTFTWTTESFNSVNPSYLGLNLGASTTIGRIRLYKDNDAGGPGLIAKNLTIEITTSDPSVPLASRQWVAVSGLSNGFQGSELLNAASVNPNGTVSADSHNSVVNGFASLTFTPVNATGIRIGFSNATPISVNHYRVYEFQVYR